MMEDINIDDFVFIEMMEDLELDESVNIIYAINNSCRIEKHDIELFQHSDKIFFGIFSLEKYFSDIWKSYQYNRDRVVEQFLIDFNRQIILVNNQQFDSALDFFEKIKHLEKKYNYEIKITYFLLTIMLCNQSSFAMSFQILSDLYGSFDENLALVSRPRKLSDSCIKSSKSIVEIVFNDKVISFLFKITLFVINTNNGEIIRKVNAETDISLSFDKINKDEIGFFTWMIHDS